MGHCANCKYFNMIFEENIYGKCLNNIFGSTYFTADFKKGTTDILLVDTNGDSEIDILVKSTFGCIHFIEKSPCFPVDNQ